MIGFFPKVFSLLLTTPLLPIWSKLFDKQKFNTLKKTFAYGLSVLSVLGFITVLIGYFAGGFILNSLYANDDIAQQGSRVLFIILAGFVLHSANYFSAYFLEAVNKEKIVRNTSLVQMFFYILGMLFFTKTSLLAPAIVFILTELISVVVYVKKILEFKKS
jgi:O-antigen/teichoic acid export membrane protein